MAPADNFRFNRVVMPRWLYLWPLNFVIVGFLVFAAIFLLMAKQSRDKTRKADPRSIVAIFIQALAFALAWTIARTSRQLRSRIAS